MHSTLRAHDAPRTDHAVIRYLDEVLVHDEGYEVKFKAGVGVRAGASVK